jgi:phytoene synthase
MAICFNASSRYLYHWSLTPKSSMRSLKYRNAPRPWIARQSASNFWFSFLLLPREKRRSMNALYAFLRQTDDLGDNDRPVENRRSDLVAWRASLAKAVDHDFTDPVLPALIDTVEKYGIPIELLDAAIDGVESDLDRTHFETFDELEQYCYQVASTVGLSCVRIWGYTSDAAFVPARACGVAFQLTNILRDLGEDARAGRVYLPAEDLKRFDCSTDDLLQSNTNERFARLMEFEIRRAEDSYEQAAELLNYLTHDGRRVYAAMLATYRGLLEEIRKSSGDVLHRRIRLPKWRKVQIAAQSIVAPGRVVSNNTAASERLCYGSTEARP